MAKQWVNDYDKGPVYLQPMQTLCVAMPSSEVCMHMRVAGKTMQVQLLKNGMAQLYDKESGRIFSSPILAGEAGIFQDSNGQYYSYFPKEIDV